MEQTAVISDIHSNLEALRAVLSDIEGRGIKKIIFLGDLIGYGPNPKEVIDIARALDLDLIVAGNHDRGICANAQGEELKFNMTEGAFFSLEMQVEALFTDNPRYFLSERYVPEMLSQKQIGYDPEMLVRLDESYGKRADAELGALTTRKRAKAMHRMWLRSGGLGIMIRHMSRMMKVNQPVFEEIERHDEAVARLEFMKSIAESRYHGIVNGMHCFHSSWDKGKIYHYVLDPYQVEMFREVGSVPRHDDYEDAMKTAKRLGKKGVLAFVKGHTHIPSIYRRKEGSIDFVLVDTGAVGMPRVREWKGVDPETGEQIEEHDCHTKASYVVTDGSNFRIVWVPYNHEDTYEKMKAFYRWDELDDKTKRSMSFMRLWASIHGDWPEKGAA